MNLTVTALQNIYTELGGDLTDTYENIAGGIEVGNYTIIPDMLNAIAQIGGSTVELPAVSSSDNGDVLEVVDGKWAKAEPTKELPTTEVADSGKFLAVNHSGEWDKADAPTELPEVTTEDNGKVLSVVDGAWDKKTAPIKKVELQQSVTLSNLTTIEILFPASNMFIDINVADSATKNLLKGKTYSVKRYNTVDTYGTKSSKLVIELDPNSGTFSPGTYKIDAYYTNLLVDYA